MIRADSKKIAALLHDSIEDQAGGDAASLRRRIMEEFGEAVLAIVEGGTDADVSPKPPWRELKETYLAHLEKAPPSVLLVSASDQLFVCQELQFGWVKEPKGNSIAVEVAVRLQPKR